MNPMWEKAIENGDLTMMKRLITAGIDVNSLDDHGQTALMVSAHHGRKDIVEMLIAEGADLNVAAKYNLNATMLAVIGRHEEVAKIIAAAGADLTQVTSGTTGFSDKTAHELALDMEMNDLAAALKPRS